MYILTPLNILVGDSTSDFAMAIFLHWCIFLLFKFGTFCCSGRKWIINIVITVYTATIFNSVVTLRTISFKWHVKVQK